MSTFTATVTVHPYSTHDGGKLDRAACGPEKQQIQLTAETIRQALAIAEIFASGIKTNPRVWMATVVSLVEEPHA